MGRPLHAMFSTFVMRVALARAGESRGRVVLVLHEQVHGAVRVDVLLLPLLGGHVRWTCARPSPRASHPRVGGSGGGLTESHAYGSEGDAGLLHQRAGLGHERVLVVVRLGFLRGGGGRGGLGLAEGHPDGAEGEADLLEDLLGAAHDGLDLAALLVAGSARARRFARARRKAPPILSLLFAACGRHARRRRRRREARRGERRRGGARGRGA